ncbi:RNA polymerase sigma factor [Streptomyces sp. NPDC005279]|uniref:RNA polymerase sigma factor n=1 Tax=Streptomyces sp. NPDC005279 TaxID=3364712 RepID=UPI0036A6E589
MRTELAAPLDDMDTVQPDEAFIDAVELAERVREVLDALPDRQREVLALRLGGLTDPEIAVALRLDRGTVSAHLSLAGVGTSAGVHEPIGCWTLRLRRRPAGPESTSRVQQGCSTTEGVQKRCTALFCTVRA